MDRLSPLDASFLHVENDVNHMHIGSCAIFECPPPTLHEMRDMVAGKLAVAPRYRQKVRDLPMHLGAPVWVNDPHFYLGYHLRQTALPRPGGVQQLRNLVGRVMAQQLDRTKPLWEMWVVEGLSDDRWAMVSKVHHCMVDGISGTDLITSILDTQAEPSPPVPDDWSPSPEPTQLELLAASVGRPVADRAVSIALDPVGQVRTAAGAGRRAASRVGDTVRGIVSMRGLVGRSGGSSLVGTLGPHRRWAWARTTLADVKSVRTMHGGTVNDVVLACITRGFRDLLLGRGEGVDGRVVRTLVPVSVRTPGERGTYNNRVSAMFAELPVGISDPVERLASIRAQMSGLKESKQAVAGQILTSLGGFAPPLLLALGTRLATSLAPRTGSVHTVTTNVPGPQHPLYAAGRRMIESFPYVPLVAPVRIGVAIFSYNGRLTFGVTGDYDAAPDIGVLCDGIEEAMTELLSAAGTRAQQPVR